MNVPHDTIVAVADGEHLHLFRSHGEGDGAELKKLNDPKVDGSNHSGGSRHASSSANPDEKSDARGMFAAATAEYLNKLAMGNKIEHAVIIAPPKMLGELRKHYHKTLEAKLLKEIAKDLTGQNAAAVETALRAA